MDERPKQAKQAHPATLHALRRPAPNLPGNRAPVDLDTRHLTTDEVRLRNETLELIKRPERWVPIDYHHHPVSQDF